MGFIHIRCYKFLKADSKNVRNWEQKSWDKDFKKFKLIAPLYQSATDGLAGAVKGGIPCIQPVLSRI